jgi:hypothetical protein
MLVQHSGMPPELTEMFLRQGRVATSAQIHEAISRAAVQRHVRHGHIQRIWPGIYCVGTPDMETRLRGLDLRCGSPVALCLHTAASVYGFDTEDSTDLHVLHPAESRLRDRPGLVVHRREGATLTSVRSRPITAPAWTAVEVARSLRRPRALATLDAALRSGTCSRDDLVTAAAQQVGRRNIVGVRDLISLARPGAESPMESEARLVMTDGGLPEPVLQYEIIDRDGRLWRVDFAWPEYRLAVEYDGFEWHSSPEHLRKDRQKRAALEELGWRYMSIVSDDVRRHRVEMIRRIDAHLQRAAA